MTKQEYIASFEVTKGRKTDFGFINDDGEAFYAMECRCGATDCRGWAMVRKDIVSYHRLETERLANAK